MAEHNAVETTTPWTVKPVPLGRRIFLALGAGSLIASFYIGTGDITIGVGMGAQYGVKLWWTYFVLGIAGWALIDMSARYFLRFGRTPMTMFKDVHPVFSAYMFLAVIVCATVGSYNQWAGCALVLTGFFPGLSTETSGFIAAFAGLLFMVTGAYARVEKAFVLGLIALIGCFFAAAFAAGFDWRQAPLGLIPNAPGPDWTKYFASNAGSMINAWLILIYPYTMIERGWFADSLQGKVNILYRARVDYGWGVLAGGLVALPLMAAAATVLKPFGIVPRHAADIAVLLEPLAGRWSSHLFLFGFFLAAWTSGIGWWMCGCYALLDLFNLDIKLDSKPARVCTVLFFLPSTVLLLLRINPFYQMMLFSAFLTLVFPVVGVVAAYRISRKDMGYFGWSIATPAGVVLLAADLFAVGLSLYLGVWNGLTEFGKYFVSR